jgi:hypothetical protein
MSVRAGSISCRLWFLLGSGVRRAECVYQQGCVMRSFGTFNTAKCALHTIQCTIMNKLHESCSEMLPAGEVLVWEQLPQGSE